ncbi:MAG: hypothetical protein J6D36_09340 [Erysipelotrichaceae bacterium]|jgi:hypothetical protein|nr:hypothetical protein [Erysipelotrichaceae bacterium]
MQKRKNGKIITVNFDASLLKNLDHYANLKGQTRTMALERIVSQHLEAEAKAQNQG